MEEAWEVEGKKNSERNWDVPYGNLRISQRRAKRGESRLKVEKASQTIHDGNLSAGHLNDRCVAVLRIMEGL